MKKILKIVALLVSTVVLMAISVYSFIEIDLPGWSSFFWHFERGFIPAQFQGVELFKNVIVTFETVFTFSVSVICLILLIKFGSVKALFHLFSANANEIQESIKIKQDAKRQKKIEKMKAKIEKLEGDE